MKRDVNLAEDEKGTLTEKKMQREHVNQVEDGIGTLTEQKMEKER